jgi:hypothetical protein
MKVTRLDQLIAIRDTLSSGKATDAEALVEEWKRLGQPVLGFVTELMAAAQRLDEFAVRELLRGDEMQAVRAEPILHFVLAHCLVQVRGLTETADEIKQINLDDSLPQRWAATYRQWISFLELLGNRAANRILEDSAVAVAFQKGNALPTVELQVNNSGANRFLVDTGAPTTVVTTQFANESRIRYVSDRPAQSIDGSGGQVVLWPGIADRISSRGLTIFDCPIHVSDLNEALGVAGILSPINMFRGRWLLFEGHALSVLPQTPTVDEPNSVVDLLWNGGNPTVWVNVHGGGAVPFLVDSGAGANILCRDLARQLRPGWAPDRLVCSPAAMGSSKLSTGFEMSISLGDSPPESIDWYVKDCFSQVDSIWPCMFRGYLGRPWFLGRKVIFPPLPTYMKFTF